MDDWEPCPQHFIACLSIDFQNDSGRVTVPLSCFVVFSSVKANLCWYHCSAPWEWSWAIHENQRGYFQRARQHLTFENNSVTGEENSPKTQQYVCDMGQQSLLEVTIAVVYYRICVFREIMIRIPIPSDNVSSWV